jgi:hypothetical protein
MKGLVHLLGVSYEAKREFVCEKFLPRIALTKQAQAQVPG